MSTPTTRRTCSRTCPRDVIEEVLTALDDQERSRLESVLRYEEDTAGGLMNLDVVTVRPDVSLETRGAIPAPARGDPREDQPAVRGGPGEPVHSARYGSPIS